jgi:hypothetical protein
MVGCAGSAVLLRSLSAVFALQGWPSDAAICSPGRRSGVDAAESFTQITFEPGKFSYHDNERLFE